jgi:hypothetical protein
MLNHPLHLLGATILALLAAVTTAHATASGVPAIPEPSMLALVAVGIGGAVLYARSRRVRK